MSGLERCEGMKQYRAELVGVFGDPVDDNPTCVVEESAFRALGLNWRYITCRVSRDDLPDAMRGMRAIGMKGVNLTMPLKVDVLKSMDELTEAARIIGAVNTVAVRNGRLLGENTDGKGFVKSLRDEQVPLQGAIVTLLGAGGAARAIGVECALAGAKQLHIINRNEERGRSLAKLINDQTGADADYLPWEGSAVIPADTQILINATPVGLGTDACPDVRLDRIKEGMVVCDVVFNPPMTTFLKEASARGAKIITGLGMLVNQGALNFELWTGEKAPYDIMYEALKNEFEKVH